MHYSEEWVEAVQENLGAQTREQLNLMYHQIHNKDEFWRDTCQLVNAYQAHDYIFVPMEHQEGETITIAWSLRCHVCGAYWDPAKNGTKLSHKSPEDDDDDDGPGGFMRFFFGDG